jgi:hypothetical protein
MIMASQSEYKKQLEAQGVKVHLIPVVDYSGDDGYYI